MDDGKRAHLLSVMTGLGEMGFGPQQILRALRSLGKGCSLEDAALFILAGNEEEEEEEERGLYEDEQEDAGSVGTMAASGSQPRPAT